ncbi:7233_t:CDS:2, partial [Racocetra persica]
NEFDKLEFDNLFVSGIIYLPSLPWLNELLSSKDTIELKNNSSFTHQLSDDDWWLPYFKKIQTKNKDLIFKDQEPFSIFCQRILELVETGMYNEPDPLLNEETWWHDTYDTLKYLLDPLISQNAIQKKDYILKAEATLEASSERKRKAQ